MKPKPAAPAPTNSTADRNGAAPAAKPVTGAAMNFRSGARPSISSQPPIEWMDPLSWKLPSGKALAEFALQAGFLAPLMLHGGSRNTTSPKRGAAPPATPQPANRVVSRKIVSRPVGGKSIASVGAREVPAESGSFRFDAAAESGSGSSRDAGTLVPQRGAWEAR